MRRNIAPSRPHCKKQLRLPGSTNLFAPEWQSPPVLKSCNSTTLPLREFSRHVISGVPHGGPAQVGGSWDAQFLARCLGDACAETRRSAVAEHDHSAVNNSASSPSAEN